MALLSNDEGSLEKQQSREEAAGEVGVAVCNDAGQRQGQGLKTGMGAGPGAKGDQEFRWRQEGTQLGAGWGARS